MANKKKACLPNLELLIAAGINPKTGLPRKVTASDGCALKSNIKMALRVIDEQDAVNRYVWYNLPNNISSQELERMLYYKGQLAFFYNEQLDEFYFMPYTLDGTIDFYGRYNTIHPVPMTTGTTEEKSTAHKNQADILSQIKLHCVYGMKLPEEVDWEVYTKSAVLLHDYAKQLSQSIIPRVTINDPLLDTMANCIPYMNTALLLGTGIRGVRVQDADQADSVVDAANSMQEAALTGKPYMPIIGGIDFQDLQNGSVGKAEEYMLAMQSLDNLRLSTYGIDNGGLFEKKTQVLQAEAAINGGPVGLVLQDGLSIRQNFCNIANSIWGTSIWCEPAENILGADRNGDGLAYNSNRDGTNSGVQQNKGSEAAGEEVNE